ncbi:hypothetical protein ACQR1Y_12325 [Bradyrhizobium sp. HKCCYLRH3099]|uniref:hypothetical protein n=1 Tax=unclassified Bradyrhizobium TaxID=2631580 RepID=UPI003EBF4633
MSYENHDFKGLTKEQLVEAAFDVIGGNDLKALSIDALVNKITVVQHAFDLCLNEIERRGELETRDGMIVIPYVCEYAVPTALTREGMSEG